MSYMSTNNNRVTVQEVGTPVPAVGITASQSSSTNESTVSRAGAGSGLLGPASSNTTRVNETDIARECGLLKAQLLLMQEELREMSAAAAKQTNIKMRVKTGMVAIEAAVIAALEHERSIAEAAKKLQPPRPVVAVGKEASRAQKRTRSASEKNEGAPQNKKGRGGSSPTRHLVIDKDAEWQTVVKGRSKKKKERNGTNAITQAKKTTSLRRRPDAVLIKPNQGQSYAEVLGRLKKGVDLEQLRVTVKTVRKTQDGGILVTLGGETANIQPFQDAAQLAIGETGAVRGLTSKVTMEVLDLDCLTSNSDVEAAIRKVVPGTSELKVHVFDPNRREQRMAVLETDVTTATALLQSGRLRVGWSNCRVRVRVTVTRCHKCLGYGHLKKECKGPDRSKACWKCGKESHKAKECPSRPDNPGCYLCRDKGRPAGETAHFPGTGMCAVFRAALKAEKEKAAGKK